MKKMIAFILSLCLVFTLLGACLADEAATESKDPFTPPVPVPAKGIEDFIGEWQFYRIIKEDGTDVSREQLLADGLVDDRAELTISENELTLYTHSSNYTEVFNYEFVPEDGTLKLLNGSEQPPVFILNDNGMLSCFVQSDTSFTSLSCYFIRVTP